MVRRRDETLPPGEQLYRSVSPSHVDGDAVLPDALDLPATSFDRSSYCTPEEVFNPRRPDETGVAGLLADDLPPPMRAPAGVIWEFFAVDDPLEENEAHAEVRIREAGYEYDEKDPKKPKSTAFKGELRKALAKKMKVVKPPT